MKIKLNKFEQSLEDTAEEFIPVTDAEKAEVENIIASANKTKNINIRISAYDMEKVKQRSAAEGLPYQTLISSVIHKYITGKLVDEQAILKSLQLLNGRR
ncbi:MAG: antitoxin [Treponema sp.]|jgi:predicted DNA binding CopG/RHH family protein|nr:antitoxin [Treponema sp.]